MKDLGDGWFEGTEEELTKVAEKRGWEKVGDSGLAFVSKEKIGGR